MKKQKYDTPFERFLTQNGLTGKQIAAFLDVSDAFVSQLRQGKVNLPEEKLALLREEGRWNLSMFPEKGPGQTISQDSSISKNTSQLDKMLDALNESLKQNSRLIGIIENLQNK